jgi:hypothetical protein
LQDLFLFQRRKVHAEEIIIRKRTFRYCAVPDILTVKAEIMVCVTVVLTVKFSIGYIPGKGRSRVEPVALLR